MNVIYTGPSDAYELGPEDFAKAGVEVNETLRFVKGEPVEVSDEVAAVLVHDQGLFGDFPFEQEQELTEDQLSLLDELDNPTETNYPDSPDGLQPISGGGPVEGDGTDGASKTQGTEPETTSTKTAKKATSKSTKADA